MVALGGAIGAVLRYALVMATAQWTRPFLGIFLINALGSFLIGLVAAVYASKDPMRMVLAIGVLGSFTTFSTFALDNLQLWRQAQWGWLLLNGMGQLLVCTLAAGIGWWLLKP